MHYEAYNIQQTRKAACNTGSKDLHRGSISCIIMPGYSLPPAQVDTTEADYLKKITKGLSRQEIKQLLAELGELE